MLPCDPSLRRRGGPLRLGVFDQPRGARGVRAGRVADVASSSARFFASAMRFICSSACTARNSRSAASWPSRELAAVGLQRRRARATARPPDRCAPASMSGTSRASESVGFGGLDGPRAGAARRPRPRLRGVAAGRAARPAATVSAPSAWCGRLSLGRVRDRARLRFAGACGLGGPRASSSRACSAQTNVPPPTIANASAPADRRGAATTAAPRAGARDISSTAAPSRCSSCAPGGCGRRAPRSKSSRRPAPVGSSRQRRRIAHRRPVVA